MYQQILVAVDGSETSNRALAEAIRLAKEGHARLRIVLVVEQILLTGEAEYVNYEEIRRAVIGYGQQVLQKAQEAAAASGVEAQTRLIEIKRFGDRVADAIAQEANTWPADLIVIGTHGRRGFSHLLMGSVAEGVMRLATKPVLLIRGGK
jgi:nucleotide-binding universal stress UspA family protein